MSQTIQNTELSFAAFDMGYDHLNYITTKGKIRPIPTGSQISNQARIYINRSSNIKATEIGLSFLSNAFATKTVYDQYRQGGMSAIDPVDETSLIVGASGMTASTFSYFNWGGSIATGVARFAGPVGIGIGVYQNWMFYMGLIYNCHGVQNWRPTTGNTQTDLSMGDDYDKGYVNWWDYLEK